MSTIFEVLFGSKARARILRFFLLNPEGEFQVNVIAKRNMIKVTEAKREINSLEKIRFVQEKSRQGKKHYSLNQNFSYYPELRSLIVKSNVFPNCQSLGKVKNIGAVRLAAVSGVFLNYAKSKADMILVADNVNRGKLRSFISNLEAEIGREISYVLMNSEELKYRMNMMDRFLLEFFRGPHDEIINKVPNLKRTANSLRKS